MKVLQLISDQLFSRVCDDAHFHFQIDYHLKLNDDVFFYDDGASYDVSFFPFGLLLELIMLED
jgi:hypothetical protein